MTTSNDRPADQPSGGDRSRPDAPAPAEVKAQLERILASGQFKGSRRSVGLLQFATERVLEGRLEGLKERLIGVEVFGRPEDYDTNGDPIVRSAAGEIRKRLAQYYLEPGHEAELRIELPPGSYVPQVHAAPEGVAERRAPRGSRLRPRFVVAGVTVAIVVASAWTAWRLRPVGVLDRFWAPVWESPGPALVCLGQPTAFNFPQSVHNVVQGKLDSPTFHADQDDYSISIADVLRFPDRYVTLHDAMCLARITDVLSRHGKPYRIRGVASTSLADLRDGPTVLIGAWDNSWTLTLAGTGKLRFVFDAYGSPAQMLIRDRQHPERTDWAIPDTWPHWSVDRDYAIVSRLVDPTTGNAVITAAGFTDFGTFAAGEFVSDPVALAEALGRAPRNWDGMNVQVVLVTRVLQGAPGRPQVLATHFW